MLSCIINHCLCLDKTNFWSIEMLCTMRLDAKSHNYSLHRPSSCRCRARYLLSSVRVAGGMETVQRDVDSTSLHQL